MKKNLLLLLSEWFRHLGADLVAIFSAIFVYRQTESVLKVLFCFLAFTLFKVLAVSLAENLAQKRGLRFQIFVGNILFSFSLFFYILANKKAIYIWPAFIVSGLGIGFFWFGRHSLLIKLSYQDQKKLLFGFILGLATFLRIISQVVTPMLGGALIGFWGYQALFCFSFAFIVIGSILLFFVPDEKTHYDTTIKEEIKLFLTHRKDFLFYFIEGIRAITYSTVFSLYLFLVLKEELNFGGFLSFALLIVALIQLLIGKWIDQRGEKNLIEGGNFLYSFAWMLRYLTKNIPALLAAEISDKISDGLVGNPLASITYKKAILSHATGRAVLFRELAIFSGHILGLLLLILGVFLGFPLKLFFLFVSLLCCFSAFLVLKQKRK